jgi:hypothetical protein
MDLPTGLVKPSLYTMAGTSPTDHDANELAAQSLQSIPIEQVTATAGIAATPG